MLYNNAQPLTETDKNGKKLMSTIDQDEIDKFTAMADEWWNPEGQFKPLHKFNPVRLDYICTNIKSHFKLAEAKSPSFKDIEILDIGCGGGLLSVPMARLGARVTGLDASDANINTAKNYAQKHELEIDYQCDTAEALSQTGKQFDVILNMEVMEHVADLDLFLASTAQLLKPDGLMFIATLNRTAKSFALAIIGAEYILRWLPRGTHDWHKFITPQELEQGLTRHNLQLAQSTGVSFNPLLNQWNLSGDMGVNYMGIVTHC